MPTAASARERAPSPLEAQQADQRRRVPRRVRRALEPGRGPGAPLADADHLAAVGGGHLAGPDRAEAHQPAQRAAGQRAVVHHRRRRRRGRPAPPATPRRPTARPGRRRRPTAGRRPGRSRRPRPWSPGRRSTTPPPDRRRTTSTSPARATPSSTRSGPWVDPSTSAGAAASSTHAARTGRRAAGAAWSSAAGPRRRSTRQPGQAGPGRHAAIWRYGVHVSGTTPEREREPARAPRLGRRVAQRHRRLVQHAVALAHVAGPAGGDDVVPRVDAAPAARHDVVDALGRAVAVLAAVLVAGEHRPAVERRRPPVRAPARSAGGAPPTARP